jgi:outer membrane biosynthesis protein TonB
LLLEHRLTTPGRVVLEFDLHSDGTITGVTTLVSTVNLLQETICESAVQDPAPYKKWPEVMRNSISDPRHLRFTFFYEN